ncbi:MAG: glutamate-5-semialdehyde dehydrogenase [Pirellulaceae bacterium]
MTDPVAYCREMAQRAKQASRTLASLSGDLKNAWLRAGARTLRAHVTEILAANAVDMEQAEQGGASRANLDRLKLTAERIESMAAGMEEIAALPDPVGEIIEGSRRPNGLEVSRVRVPLGVVFFVYESRPNVTVDAAAICVKSGNAVILRGGREALHSSLLLVNLLNDQAREIGLPSDAVQLVDQTDRELVGHFLRLADQIDVAIPRGGEGLIRRVVAEATMPVIKHYHGNCHLFVDASADLPRAIEIIENAKCQRPGVCNALESLLVHESIAQDWLPRLAQNLGAHGVELRGCPRTCEIVASAVPATTEDYATEFLDLILSVRVVTGVDEAMEHIAQFSSGHTDAVLATDSRVIRRFVAGVDSAAVMVNASTRFNDGGELGLGAEIGISTDKFHARGPCGVRELTTYKFVCVGDGQIRT